MRQIFWSELPKEDIGFGREGRVFRLDDNRCIKVYSEQYQKAREEFDNARLLLDNGLRAPEPLEVAEVLIDTDSANLPWTEGYTDLASVDRSSTCALIRQYSPGRGYGSFRPTIDELRRLRRYIKNMFEKGFYFDDRASLDFFLDQEDVLRLDCTGLRRLPDDSSRRGIEDHFIEGVRTTLERALVKNKCKPPFLGLSLAVSGF